MEVIENVSGFKVRLVTLITFAPAIALAVRFTHRTQRQFASMTIQSVPPVRVVALLAAALSLQSAHGAQHCAPASSMREGMMLLDATASAAPIADAGDFVSAPAFTTATFGFYRGLNMSGMEQGDQSGITIVPGVAGPTSTNTEDYTIPTPSEISYFAGKNMQIVRLPFAWERLQTTLGGSLDPTYLGYLHTTVSSIRAQGMSVLLDVHNYGCYNQQHICLTANPSSKPILVTSAQFSDLWTKLANEFKGDSGVMFGLMNEPKQWDYSGEELQCAEWVSIANAAIAAIRATGATNWITVPGNFYTGAWSWSSTTDTVGASNATTLTAITDSAGKFVIEVHQYLDSDDSGTSDNCSSSTCGAERLETFTDWLRTNGKQGFLGEFAGGYNTTCNEAVEGMLNYIVNNADVWGGWTYWGQSNRYLQYSIQPTNWGYMENSKQATITPADAPELTYVLTPFLGSAAACGSDLDGDLEVGPADISLLLMEFGDCVLGNRMDLDSNRRIDFADLGKLLLFGGMCN